LPITGSTSGTLPVVSPGLFAVIPAVVVSTCTLFISIDEARQSHSGLPVILCTGFSEEIDSEKAEQLDICYLSKPTDPDGLLNAVGELISPLLDSANPSQATAAS